MFCTTGMLTGDTKSMVALLPCGDTTQRIWKTRTSPAESWFPARSPPRRIIRHMYRPDRSTWKLTVSGMTLSSTHNMCKTVRLAKKHSDSQVVSGTGNAYWLRDGMLFLCEWQVCLTGREYGCKNPCPLSRKVLIQKKVKVEKQGNRRTGQSKLTRKTDNETKKMHIMSSTDSNSYLTHRNHMYLGLELSAVKQQV